MNPEGSKTMAGSWIECCRFESSVNPEGSKTTYLHTKNRSLFESSVNPEGSKTGHGGGTDGMCLRVV